MLRSHRPLSSLSTSAVFATAMLAAVALTTADSPAAYSCTQQLPHAKRHVGDLNAPRPHMGIAAKHLAAAEEALQEGDEAACLEALKKAEMWIRMRSRGGHDR